jgi:hypothetical protein
MKRRMVVFLAWIAAGGLLWSQSLSFGLGDPVFEASLNDIGASAKVDMAGFTAELSLTWGVPAAQVQQAMGQGLLAAEVYLASGLAKISGKPLSVVIDSYKKNKVKGWGALAKELGIKPGSKEFKLLKDKAAASSEKAKKPKKK